MHNALKRLELPSPRGVALAILRACQREDVTLPEIVALIQPDPALSARLIALANAASSGVRPAVSVADAVSRLGISTVRNVALAFSLLDQHGQGACAAFDYKAYWRGSLLMALALRELTSRCRAGSPDELFTCGLMAGIGRLALASAYPREYGAVLALDLQGAELRAAEQEAVHTDHVEVALELMAEWGFPAPLAEPLPYLDRQLPTPPNATARLEQLIRIFRLGQALTLFCEGDDTLRRQTLPDVQLLASALGMGMEDVGAVVDEMSHQGALLGPMLEVQLPPLPTFSEVLAQMPGESPLQPPANDQHRRVLVVEDDPVVRSTITEWLRAQGGYQVREAVDGQEALRDALDFRPHLIITDLRMPGLDGVGMCRALRQSAWGRRVYVLMLTVATEIDAIQHAYEAGVDDVMHKPLDLRLLSARMHAAQRYIQLLDAWLADQQRLVDAMAELELTNRRLEHAALVDDLTDLPNRRAGLASLEQAWAAAQRRLTPLSLMLIDVDHFKNVNDRHGHATGDKALKAVAGVLRQSARQEDTVSRWGGEEFMVLTPGNSLRDALASADRMRRAIQAHAIEAGPGLTLKLTVSIGVSTVNAGIKSVETLLHAADEAMYLAKQRGRNLVGFAMADGPRLLTPPPPGAGSPSAPG